MRLLILSDRPDLLLFPGNAVNDFLTTFGPTAPRSGYRRARCEGRACPIALSSEDRLIPNVPLLRAFDVDLKYAGIQKEDDRKRTVDIHSLRHTFGTLLARSGVAPRTAMDLMRHADIRLTTAIYQHLDLVDTAGAVNRLPVVGARTVLRKTGTDTAKLCPNPL